MRGMSFHEEHRRLHPARASNARETLYARTARNASTGVVRHSNAVLWLQPVGAYRAFATPRKMRGFMAMWERDDARK